MSMERILPTTNIENSRIRYEKPSFRNKELRHKTRFCKHWTPASDFNYRKSHSNYNWNSNKFKVDHRLNRTAENKTGRNEKIQRPRWQQSVKFPPKKNQNSYFSKRKGEEESNFGSAADELIASAPSENCAPSKIQPNTQFQVENITVTEFQSQTAKEKELETVEADSIVSPQLDRISEKSTKFDINVKVKQEEADISINIEQEAIKIEKENHIESDGPKISLIPLSNLIKQELQNLSQEQITPIVTSPTQTVRSTHKPNLVQRRRNPSTSLPSTTAEEVVNKVANMDKVGIQNIINNYGTKYDAALKVKARKHLREEIRKQLKTMNFEQSAETESSNAIVVPDEIVDSIHIPDVIIDEIRRAFGCEFIQSNENNNSLAMAIEPTPPVEQQQVCPEQPPMLDCLPKSPKDNNSSSDLMLRLKAAEETKIQAEKQSQETARTTIRKRRIAKTQTPARQNRKKKRESNSEVIVITSSASSRSSSSSSSCSSSSTTSSSSSADSRSASTVNRRSKQPIDAGKVLDNFETLILPYMCEEKRISYRKKFRTQSEKLQFIFYTCIGKLNPRTFSKKENNRIKNNLKSHNNSIALRFLMKEIVNIFNKHKESRRIFSESLHKTKEHKSNISTEKVDYQRASEVILKDSRIDNCTESNKQDNFKNITNSKDLPPQKDKNADTTVSKSVLSLQSKPTNSSATAALLISHQSGANDNQLAARGGDEKADSAQVVVVAQPVLESMPQSLNEKEVKNQNSREQESHRGNKPQHPANSSFHENIVAHNADSLGESYSEESHHVHMRPPSIDFTLGGVNTDSNPMICRELMLPSCMLEIDLEHLKQQSLIGEAVVNNLKEIDLQLMELHKRKMFIEEMILKLQKEKMDADLLAMKLQHEKFVLLNTAMVTNASARTPLKSFVKSEEPTTQAFRKSKNKIEQTKNTTNCSSQMQHPEDTKDSYNPTTTDLPASDVSVTEVPSAHVVESLAATGEDDLPENELPPTIDYSKVPCGNLLGIKNSVTQIIVHENSVLAASEDGNLYKYNIHTLELEKQFAKHRESITQIYICSQKKVLYTTSLDGYLKKTCIENFDLDIQSINVQEPLQSMDLKWDTAFIGSRWGNIFIYNTKTNNLSESLLCSSESSVIALRATKEGPRKILIVASKGNQINFRDATTGLLLRSLDAPDIAMNYHSLLLDVGCIYCGTQKNEIYRYDFTTGTKLATFKCGNGAISMKLYRGKFIFVGCYDGFVYVLDKITGHQIGRFPGSGKMILSLELFGDKIITSSKDKAIQINDIPKYITIKAKS